MADADELITLRDLLRFAVSRFNAAKLSYGHGTANALDEAAFLLLEGLKLPIDDINPWLDARLTRAERERLLGLIAARVTSRKPAPYLVDRAYIRGMGFAVDERVIVPRSYLGELLLWEPSGDIASDLDGLGKRFVLPAAGDVGSILDLCTGGGSLAIIAAREYPGTQVDAVDLSADALAVARTNVEEYGLAGRINLIEGDLFAPLGGKRYDLIVSNPPYVAAAEVAAFPPEHAAEPRMAHLGGEDGLDIVRRILAEASAHLNPEGGLLCEIGTGRELLQAEFDLPFTWLDTEESEGEVFWIGAEGLRK